MLSSLKDALKSRMRNLKVIQPLNEFRVLSIWKDVVGVQLARQTQARKMIQGKLYVTVTSSVWAHQLSFYRREYIEKLNKKLGQPLVKDIFFQVGNIDAKEEELERVEEDVPTVNIELNAQEKDMIEKTVSSIPTEELQNAFRILMEKDAQARKMKEEKGWRTCQVCGTACPPEEEYCWFCHPSQSSAHRARLLRWFEETPWIGFQDARKLIPNIQADEFSHIKEEVKRKLLEELVMYKATLDQQEKADRRQAISQKALSYVMLVTELTPDALDHSLMRETLEEQLYEWVFGT